jgi:hypothetical protein
VFGSGAARVTGTFHSRKTAIGFGPRAPTPVRKIIVSIFPSNNASANFRASMLEELIAN